MSAVRSLPRVNQTSPEESASVAIDPKQTWWTLVGGHRCTSSVDSTRYEGISLYMDWRNLETFSFGDGPDLANELLELVLSGAKRATCWAESQGLLSAKVGKMMVVLDGQGVPRAVLKTTELKKRRFEEVDEAFAYDEGEGDRSLQYWREAHINYFSRLGIFAPNMMLWCERFELIELIE